MSSHQHWFFHTVMWPVILMNCQWTLTTGTNSWLFLFIFYFEMWSILAMECAYKVSNDSAQRLQSYGSWVEFHWPLTTGTNSYLFFLIFFFWNAIYSSYGIHIQNFEGFCSVVAELWVIGGISLAIDYRYEFLLVFLDFFFEMQSILATKCAYKISKDSAQWLQSYES